MANYIQSLELKREEIESFEKYPFNLDVVKNLDRIDFDKNVTFLLWDNWSWKSTLIEALAVEYWFNAEGGSMNFNFYTKRTHSDLSEKIKLSRWFTKPEDRYFLRAETFYNLATNVDELNDIDWGMYRAYWWKSLHAQSHWESFFSLFLHRFFWNWLYILDEPEAALSPEKQMAFLIRLDELVKQNSQFIIVTHSPIILSYPNAKIIEISEKWFNEVCYKDTKHYNTYKMFLDNPDYMLGKLGVGK